ncbi:MAG: hypothetical protein CME61_07175 [Halobacteriovoraceae bacterium]|nr:hypothetical protein [Halobacteriovoraceae bacterium]
MEMREFYKFYLSEHKNITNRRLHFLGTLFALTSIIYIIKTKSFALLFIPVIFGYGPAWIGHFFFEKNRPASFKHPFKSFLCDWWMAYEILIGKISIK